MSLYDRDYYRQDPRGWPSGTRSLGLSVTTWLIIVNVAMFFVSAVIMNAKGSPVSAWWPENLYLDPYAVFGKARIWQLVTCMFLHGDLLHLLFNMFGLWMFGRGLETLYGRREFLAFYFEAGIAASLAFVVSSLLRGDSTPALGASGSVFGVIALCAIRFPMTLVYVWGIFPLRMWQLAVLTVGLTLWAMIQGKDGGIAHAAHLGGAVYGGAYWLFDLRWSRIAAALSAAGRGRGRATWDERPPSESEMRGDEWDVRRKVDGLLDKISKQGLASLTREERDFLNEASRRFRKD